MSVDNNCPTREGGPELRPEQRRIYAKALSELNRGNIPFLIAGAFAHHAYTGIWRDTKDLDLFLKGGDVSRALDILEKAGFEVEMTERHWLAKAWERPFFIDLIFGMGNRIMQVDESWIARARTTRVCAVEARLIPIEELVASKVYIAKRDRFDGADVAHLIRSARGSIDWNRVAELLGENQDLLLWHWILFDFIYPGHADYLPQEMMVRMFQDILRRWQENGTGNNAFRGDLLDERAFAVDVRHWGYHGRVSERERPE